MPKLRLDSWKSIAEYLERSPRTVQRWHAFHSLPVHHLGGCKGSVFAYPEEIDRWLLRLGEETRSADCDGDGAQEARQRRSLELTAHAREMWETHSEANLNNIAGLYRKAIEQYSSNPRAFIGLAETMICAAVEGVMDSAIAFPCAMEAQRRAAQLDADDVDGRCAMVWLKMVYERKWPQVRSGFEEVLSKQPQSAFALSGLSLLHIAEGDLSAASQCAWEAWRRNPMLGALGSMVCWSEYLQGRFEAALELVAQMRRSGDSGATMGVIEALALNQAGPAMANLRRIEFLAAEFPQNQTLQGALGYAYAISRKPDKALEILQSLERINTQKKRNHAYGLALIVLGLGQGREALPWLESAYEAGSLWSFGFRTDPVLWPLRGEPRFESLLRKIGTSPVNGAQAVPPFNFNARPAHSNLGRRGARELARL